MHYTTPNDVQSLAIDANTLLYCAGNKSLAAFDFVESVRQYTIGLAADPLNEHLLGYYHF